MAILGDYVSIKASSKHLDGDEFWLLNLDMVEQQTGQVIEYNYVPKDKLNGSIIKFDTDCVLYSKLRPNLNKVVVPEFDGYATSEMLPLRPKSSILSRTYLAEYLRSDQFVMWAISKTAGAKMPRLGTKELLNKTIAVPSLEEQRSIVLKIEKIKAIISHRRNQLSKLDELVKSRFIEMFGNISICSGSSGVPLGTICTTLSGGTPTTKIPEYYQGDIPWITTPFLGSNHIDGNNAKAYITEEAIDNSATHLIPENTIMFGIRVGVGKSSIIDEPMCANQDIVALMGVDTSKYNLLFLKHVLDGYQDYFDTIKKGATILGITTDDLKKVIVPNAEFELQNEFATFVEQTDKIKLEVKESLEKLETLKKSLMQEYFG